MKRIIFLIVFQIAMANAFSQVSFGDATKINKDWKFQKGDIENAATTGFDDSGWRQLDLPHDWSVEAPLSPNQASSSGYLPAGIGWYRKNIDIPLDMKTKKVFIYFEGIYRNGEVFINGTSLGMRPNGFISYMYDLTPYIKFGDKNIISVKVDHSKSADSRFYTGSGIYRNVYLIYANPIHIDLWGVYYTTPVVSAKQAKVHVQTALKNTTNQKATLTVVHEILDKSNKVIAKVSGTINVSSEKVDTAKQDLTINQPNLWNINEPYLYKISTSVYEGEKLIDKTTGSLGVRSLGFDANKGFSLNGQSMKVKGVCLHHDAGVLGSAVPREVWKRRLVTLKEMGCNAIRTSHNPQASDLYEICDEIGLVVMDEAFDEWEFPKRKWIEGWNVGTPGFEGSFDFFEEWSSRDLADMILRDRNHASVIMWSIANEVDYPNDPYSHPILNGTKINQPMHGGYKPDAPKAERLGGIAKRLAAVVRANDTSRPVTAALAGVVMSNETDYPFVLDVCGYNYTEDRYTIDHAKYPKRVIFGSENGHSMESWKAVRDNDYIFAQFLWTGIDYLGESNAWPSRGFNSGFLDFGGFLKPRGHFRQSLWDTKPVTYIGTYPVPEHKKYLSTDAWPIWNYEAGEMIRVVGYTNAAQSKLMLNGKQVGEIKPLDDNTGVIYWDIPYQVGKIEIIGMDTSGNQICNYAIQSSTRPAALTANADVKTLNKENGLAQITVQVVDENGVPVMLSDDEITCTIEGPARLLGLEASNNSDMGDYTDNVQRTYHGRLLAYIQTTGQAGTVNLKFTSPWLKDGKLTIEVTE